MSLRRFLVKVVGPSAGFPTMLRISASIAGNSESKHAAKCYGLFSKLLNLQRRHAELDSASRSRTRSLWSLPPWTLNLRHPELDSGSG
jgi:hypothetical protein